MSDLHPLTPGQSFGRYRIDALLGVGGMGAVYRAHDTQLGRSVALKLVRKNRVDVSGVDPSVRLLGEARAAAALRHPNVARVYDAGSLGDEVYVAMELVEGQPLRNYVGDGTVDLAERRRWLIEVARGLEAAHRAGIVHRDVKPDNVIVGTDRVARVIDFGLAKRIAFDTSVETVKTVTPETAVGRVVGTVSYMAPEQLAGGEPSPSWDQYAWGVMAYELLSGKHPRRAALREPLPLVNELEPGVGFDEAAAVALAIAPAPERRFASMTELLRAFGSEPARRSSGAAIRAKLPASPRSRTVLYGAFAFAVAGAGVGIGMCARRGASPTEIAAAPKVASAPVAESVVPPGPSASPSAVMPTVLPSVSATATTPTVAHEPRSAAPPIDSKTCECFALTERLCPPDTDYRALKCLCISETAGNLAVDAARKQSEFAGATVVRDGACSGWGTDGKLHDGAFSWCGPACPTARYAGLHRAPCRGRRAGTGETVEGILFCY